MGGSNFTNEQQKLADIRIQSSSYGNTVPWVLTGRGRVAGNLLHYSNFKAIKHSETQSGGKGGGGSQTTVSYTYQAAVVIGLARGPLVGAGAMWRGKSQFASYGAGGLSFAAGNLGQAVWSWMQTNDPTKALGYSGMAYAYAQSYDLDSSASLPNHNFEVDGGGLGSVAGVAGTVYDGDPRLAVERLLTDTRSGGRWPSARLLGLDRYQTYCRAAGLWFSPVLTEQRSCIEWLKQLLMLTNTKAAYTGSDLELVPLGDSDISAHGATFTAEVTPDFDLTLDHFMPDEGDPPVRLRRHFGLGAEAETASSDDVGFNVITLKIESRASGYAEQSVSRDDLASIEMYGRREKPAISAPEVKDPAIGAQIAQQLLQDELAKRNRYEFNLPWRFCLMRPLRLVTLTEPSLGFDRLPVRILEAEELDDRRIACVAEDAPIGIATAPRYGSQAGSGFAPDYNVSPGDALAPAIFELPGALTTTGLELAIATASTNPNWGGCEVWVSFDGGTYRMISRLDGPSRFGALTADAGSSVTVTVNAGRQLMSGGATDAARLATLCYLVPAAGVSGEYFAHEEAELVSAGTYTLKHLIRAAYGTTQAAHASGTGFVRVDDAVARSGALDPALIGKTVYVKLCSFNVFGAATQSLADVSPTTYTITGAHFISPSATLAIKRNQDSFAAPGGPNYNECWIHGRDASGVAVDAPGVILVNGQAKQVPNGALYGNNGSFSGFIVWDMGGTVFTVLGIAGYPYAAVRRYGTQWQYDPNNGQQWVNFTPTQQTVVIGTVESGAPDAGAPGAPPGIVAATMWAHASTLDALVSSAALPSVVVKADNQNAVDAGFSGRGVLFSTGYNHSSGGRGHTLTIYDPAADAVSNTQVFDTYASGTAGLVAALAAVPAGRIVTLYTNDASTHDAALRTALVDFGGSGASALWGAGRVSHAFIGQRGLLAGQAFEAISSAADATGVVTLQAYYTPTSLVRNGASGTNGTPGLAGADGQTTYVHIKYSNDGGSTFTASAGEAPGAFIGTRTDFTPADSSNPGDYTWALIKGADGTNGTPGAAGADGQTSYVHIKYSNDGGSTFTASAGETPGAFIGTRTDFVLADSSNPGDYTWALIKGADGTNGTPGATGADGQTSYLHIKYSNDGGSTFTASAGETPGAYIGTRTDFVLADSSNPADYTWALIKGADSVAMTLSAASVTLQANSAGVVSDYSPATTTAKVMKGASDDTSNWTFSRTNGSGVTSSLSGATLSVTAMTGDSGYVDVTASRAGYSDQTARFTLAKAKVGAPPAAPTVSISGGNLFVTKPNGGASYGSRTASASGGQSPYTYEWTIVYQAKDNSNPGSVSIGGSGATVNVNGSGTDNIITGQIQCVATDYYGSKGTASFYVNATHGSPL